MMYIQSIFNHYILIEKRFNCIMVYKYFSDTITTQQTVRRFSAWNYIINNMQKYPCLQCMIYRGYKLNGFPVLFVTRRGYLIRFYTSISDPHLTKKGISTSKCVTNFYLYSAISLSVAKLSIFFLIWGPHWHACPCKLGYSLRHLLYFLVFWDTRIIIHILVVHIIWGTLWH